MPPRIFSAAVVLVLFVAAPAHADPLFPGRVADLLEMACAPPCTICHRDNNGGYGTLRTTEDGKPGFGATLRARYGLDPRDASTLKPALAQALIEGMDVDDDGAVDIYELADGTDPNSAGGDLTCGPEYGCFASIPKPRLENGARGAVWLGGALGAARMLRRARRS